MKNLLKLGIDIYSIGLSCSTVIYAYFAYAYDAILSTSVLLHFIVFFSLPFFGVLLYLLIFSYKKSSNKIVEWYVDDSWTSKGRLKYNLASNSRISFNKMSKQELEKILTEIEQVLKDK